MVHKWWIIRLMLSVIFTYFICLFYLSMLNIYLKLLTKIYIYLIPIYIDIYGAAPFKKKVHFQKIFGLLCNNSNLTWVQTSIHITHRWTMTENKQKVLRYIIRWVAWKQRKYLTRIGFLQKVHAADLSSSGLSPFGYQSVA